MKQYIIYAKDHTDAQALERRMAVRPKHFEGVHKLKEAGNYILGGAILDADGKMIGSTMILQFETEADFQQWYDNEPYVQSGVWDRIEINPYRMASV